MSPTTLATPPSLVASPGRTSRPVTLPGAAAECLLVPGPGGLVDYANLDHAASTPALTAVKEAVDRALSCYSSVHRGNGYASRVTSRWYEQARLEVARFLGARRDDLVVFTRGTTDSWSLLAAALPEDTTVFVFAAEHHSTLLPWGPQRTVTLPIPTSLVEAFGRVEAALAASTARHRLLVVTGASNVTGEVWPLRRLAAITARHGARLALDAAQLAPHRPIDLAASGVDYVAFSGHKLYAPFGSGVLAGRADWLEAAPPYLVGGGATTRVTVGHGGSAAPTWATGAARHEGGSPNAVGAVALAAACAAIRERWDDVIAYEESLGSRVRTGLAAVPGVRVYTVFGDGSGLDRVGVVPFTVDGADSAQVSAALSYRHGIGVRDGRFCAHLLVDHLLADQQHATAVRASVGLANTPEHVERLLGGVAEIAREAARARRSGTTWAAPVDPQAERDAARPW